MIKKYQLSHKQLSGGILYTVALQKRKELVLGLIWICFFTQTLWNVNDEHSRRGDLDWCLMMYGTKISHLTGVMYLPLEGDCLFFEQSLLNIILCHSSIDQLTCTPGQEAGHSETESGHTRGWARCFMQQIARTHYTTATACHIHLQVWIMRCRIDHPIGFFSNWLLFALFKKEIHLQIFKMRR